MRLELEPSLARIVASADQLRQILLNLTLNSTQAMPDGGEITIRTRAARRKRGAPAGAAESVILEIADNGPGIAPDVRDRLFEPFVTTKERGGTGLGLWICREIIQAHSGTIRVEAVAPRGTRFVISLPVRRKEER